MQSPQLPKISASKENFARFWKKNKQVIRILAVLILSGFIIAGVSYASWQEIQRSQQIATQTQSDKSQLEEQLASVQAELLTLQNQDQKVRNDELEKRLKDLESTYTAALKTYERLLDLQDKSVKTDTIEKEWAEVLTALAKADYPGATEKLATVDKNITAEEQKLVQVAAVAIPQAPASNDAPSSGYSRQQVSTQVGNFVISMVAADLGSTRVIVDTASDGNCGNDCPVLSLADYVSRNGGFAGINGSYFCPASYPSCAGKTNTFDLLVMNKNKVYFNSDNNVYSNNPAVIFGSGYVRFVGAASEWGRDTGVDGVLSNYPLLVSGGQNRFGGDGDPKKEGKGSRSFVANKGNTVYIGVVHGASVSDAAWALSALGMDNAMNLDSGGSTALWSGGYKAGPGRNIPNAIVFVRK